jgi:hypothetical protein
MKQLLMASIVALTATSAMAQVSGSVSVWGKHGSVSITAPAQVYVQPPVYITPPTQVYVQPPVYVAPQPAHRPWPDNRYCTQHPYYDQNGRLVGYETSCH